MRNVALGFRSSEMCVCVGTGARGLGPCEVGTCVYCSFMFSEEAIQAAAAAAADQKNGRFSCKASEGATCHKCGQWKGVSPYGETHLLERQITDRDRDMEEHLAQDEGSSCCHQHCEEQVSLMQQQQQQQQQKEPAVVEKSPRHGEEGAGDDVGCGGVRGEGKDVGGHAMQEDPVMMAGPVGTEAMLFCGQFLIQASLNHVDMVAGSLPSEEAGQPEQAKNSITNIPTAAAVEGRDAVTEQEKTIVGIRHQLERGKWLETSRPPASKSPATDPPSHQEGTRTMTVPVVSCQVWSMHVLQLRCYPA